MVPFDEQELLNLKSGVPVFTFVVSTFRILPPPQF